VNLGAQAAPAEGGGADLFMCGEKMRPTLPSRQWRGMVREPHSHPPQLLRGVIDPAEWKGAGPQKPFVAPMAWAQRVRVSWPLRVACIIAETWLFILKVSKGSGACEGCRVSPASSRRRRLLIAALNVQLADSNQWQSIPAATLAS